MAESILYCPLCHTLLERGGDGLLCPVHARIGEMRGPVAVFLPKPDGFYEGKYNNRTKFIPAGEGFLATLPMRVVLQHYPTAVAREVRAGSVVVDVGCAGGIAWFGERYEMIGVDLSERGLNVAAENYTHLIQCDAFAMPLAERSVDAVVSSFLFEHLTADQKAAFLAECHRVLKPGGRIVFNYDLATENPVIRRYRDRQPNLYKTLFLDGDGHLGYQSVQENRTHFESAGFRISREIFVERTPLLSGPAWSKLAEWPGLMGAMAKVGRFFSNGVFRIPMLVAISVADMTIGKVLPQKAARVMITVAERN